MAFPTAYSSQIQDNFFPTILPRNFSELGQNTASLDNWKSQIVNGTLTKTLNRHNLTFGGEYRRIRMNFQDFSNAPGTYSFSGQFTQSSPSATGDGTGSDLADLLLGYPTTGEVDITTPLFTYLDYGAIFAQDDWRATPRLTLNLGLRYEGETGLKEDHNQLAVALIGRPPRNFPHRRRSPVASCLPESTATSAPSVICHFLSLHRVLGLRTS